MSPPRPWPNISLLYTSTTVATTYALILYNWLLGLCGRIRFLGSDVWRNLGMAVYFTENNPKKIGCSESNTIQLKIRDLFLLHFLTDTSEEVPSNGRHYVSLVRKVTDSNLGWYTSFPVFFSRDFSQPLLASSGIVPQIRLWLLPSWPFLTERHAVFLHCIYIAAGGDIATNKLQIII